MPARSTSRSGRTRTSRTRRGCNSRLNWLRAGVLGANDGIVSTAGIVMGVAGATSDRDPDLGGRRGRSRRGRAEHGAPASTSRSAPSATPSRRCSPRSAASWRGRPRTSWPSWPGSTSRRGSPRSSPSRSPSELTAHDALGAHAEAELGIDPDDLTSPWNAAWPRWSSFTVGALLPLLTITLVAADVPGLGDGRAVAVALAVTGLVQRPARLRPRRPRGRPQRRRRAARDGRHVRDRPLLGTQRLSRLDAACACSWRWCRRRGGRAPGRVPGVRREAAAFRWARPEQFHVTLAFLAEVPDRQLDDLVERLAPRGARRTPFATRWPAAAPSRTPVARGCSGPGSTSTTTAGPS